MQIAQEVITVLRNASIIGNELTIQQVHDTNRSWYA